MLAKGACAATRLDASRGSGRTRVFQYFLSGQRLIFCASDYEITVGHYSEVWKIIVFYYDTFKK
jgi:hypothetical protein